MQGGSNDRVNSIGTNQYVSRYAAAVREMQCHSPSLLLTALNLATKMNCIGGQLGHGSLEHFKQIGPI